MPPVLSTERIAHLGTAGDCCAAAFQSSLCRSWVIRVAPTASKASPNVRYAFNSDRIRASQRTDAMCQEATYTPQQSKGLLNHLVGQREQLVGDFEAERPSGLEVDHQLELGWLLDWYVSGFCAAQNLVEHFGSTSEQV